MSTSPGSPGALSAALEKEHRLIDEGIEAFDRSQPAEVADRQRAAVAQAVSLLRHHIYVEEEFLFPPLREAGLIGPVMVMEHEHGQMWPLLDRLEQDVRAGNADAAGSLCRDLIGLLADHNRKEEQILYPQADALLSAPEIAALLARLSDDELPGGWVSRGTPRG